MLFIENLTICIIQHTAMQMKSDKIKNEERSASAAVSATKLKHKYDVLKQCNKDLLKTIRKYEKVCYSHGLQYKRGAVGPGDDCGGCLSD